MIAYLWVAIGSAIGGVARYGFGLAASRAWGDDFPWGTVAINIIGSFIIGFAGTLTAPEGALPGSANLRLFILVGLCGGFTTFSSFSLQTFSLARDGNWPGAAGNIAVSVVACLLAVTLGTLSAGRLATRTDARIMPHSIVAVLDRTTTARSVLVAAQLAADGFGDTRITALHLRHDGLAGFMPTEDVMTAERRDEIDGAAAAKSADIKAIFDAWPDASRIGAWRERTGETASVVSAEASGADLIVLGHANGAPNPTAHAALFMAKRPTLLVGDAFPATLGRHIAIAWKPSEAADRAIAAVMPLLQRADRVTVLVATDDAPPDRPPSPALDQLRETNVAVTTHCFQAAPRSIGRALLAEAHASGADLLVMGAYSRGRLAEFVLGGATREVLAAADMPVLMRA
jgi:protein CrcB